MASEKLTIELQAKTNQLDAKLKSVDAQLNEISKSTDKADSKFKKFTASTKKAGNIVLGVVAGAAGAAMTAIIATDKSL